MDTRLVRRDATRSRILESAWELARQEGLAGFSLRDLAQVVGMRAPSLYNYFASKNAMYDAMYAEAAEALSAALDRRREAADPRQTLRNRVRSFVGFCVADPLRYQLLLERPIPGFAPSAESFAITAAALAETRADLKAVGVAGERALDLMRALITGLVTLQVANDPGGNRWTRLQDEALEMFLSHQVAKSSKTSMRVHGLDSKGRPIREEPR